MRLLKRTLSAFLAFVMVFTMLPLQVWASETQQDTSDQPVNFGSMVEPAAGGDTEYDYTIRVGDKKTIIGEFLKSDWSSDKEGIVKISNKKSWSADITGIAPGVATITHKGYFNKSETFRVKVLPLVDSLTLSTETMTLTGKQTEKLTATLVPENANVEVEWTSSAPAVATVDENGLVTSRGLGDTIITASVEGHPEIKDECRVNVEYDYATTGETKIYVYLEIKNETGKELEGWTINESNFYTVGQYSVPFGILKPADYRLGHGEPLDKDSYVTRDISDITGYLPWTEFHPSNAAVVGSVDLSQIPWKLRYVTNGANHYQDKGACWHLDGLYTLKNEMAKVTVHYKDRFGNTIADSVTDNNIEIGDQYTIRIKDIPGYTPVSINGEPIKNGSTEIKQPVVGKDVTFTVIYNGNPTNYILEYKDIATREKIKDSETVESEKGKTILAKDIERKKIPNFEFVKITPDSIQVGKDGANTFTLWYKRNTHTVTYKYTNPITGKEVIVGPETKGAGLEVNAEKIPNIPGYKFTGWEDAAETGKVKIENGKFTMPDRDVTFTGSFSVPDSQKYAVKATIKLADRVLASETKTDISWGELGQYYEMNTHELANAFWNLGLTSGENMTATWEPLKADAAMQYEAAQNGQYHEVTITLPETSPALVTLTYDANGEGVTNMPNQQSAKYLKGTEVTVSDAQPRRENYTFEGWTTERDDPKTKVTTKVTIDNNTTLYALWTANTAEYKVQYLFQTANGSGYEQRSDVGGYTASGNIGDKITPLKLAEDKIPTGFAYESHDANVEISADGKAVAQVYYDRNVHNVVYKITGEYFANDRYRTDEGIRFGAELPAAPEDMDKAGYVWSGWSERPGTMPDKNVEITGSYSAATNTQYTVKYFFQDVTGDGYSQKLEEYPDATFQGTTHAQTDARPLAETPEGFHHNVDKTVNVEITADGKAVAQVYYDRNVHNVVYKITGEYFANANYRTDEGIRFGAELPAAPEDMDKAGYVWSGWSERPGTMPDKNVEVTGSYSLQTGLPYTVKYIWNGEILDTVPGTGTFGDPIDPEVKPFDGYTFKEKDKDFTITADPIQNVVNVYYYKNVTLKANSDNNRIYNGETQTAKPGYESSEKNAVFEGIVPTGSGKDAKEYPVAFPANTLNTVDKTKLYIVTEVKDGKLTINPKAVTLSTESASKDYDGTALTKDGVDGRDGFVTGDVTTVRATGTQTLVGESKNTIEIVWAGDALAKNYTITENLGTLTVTAPETFDYVQKDANNEKFAIGEKVTFTITVTNIYDVSATVVLEEQVGMTFEGGKTKLTDRLDAGETKTYSVSYVVTEADVEAGEIANKVTWTLTPKGKGPIQGSDSDTIKNKSYLVWYVLEGDIGGCANIGKMPEQASYKYGKTVTVWMPELAEGYKFSGWMVDGEPFEKDSFDMPENAVILTGTISKEQVKVDYKAQEGGLVTDPKNGLTSESFVETLSYGANAQGAVAVANEGYTFLGWKRDNAFVERDEVIAPTEVKESVAYTAVFAKNYTVTYQVEGVTEAYATQTHYAGEAGVEVLNGYPEKVGYDFSGWTTADTTVLNGKFTMPEQDVLFTGSYTAHTNLVWYVLEGDRGGCANIGKMPEQASYEYGKTVTVWMPELAEGYKFSGWMVDGEPFEKDSFDMPENAVILTGTISKKQVKVDYKAQEGGLITDSNGLSNADLAEMVPYGENAKGATASAKKGYTFVEWQDANHKQVSTDPEFIPTNVTAPATYYAVFAKQKVKVEYTADVGGFITSPSGAAFGSVIEQVTYGENAVGATASAKPGYYFVHWLDAEGNEVSTELHFAPENVTEEAVYKAVFAEQTAIEVKAEDLRKEYDGTAIEANDKYTTNTTLKDGHKLVVTTKVSKDVINATDTDGKHQIDSIKILDANDKDVIGQYQVSKADGSLTILPKPISIEVADGVKTYGETELEITVTANGLVNENDLGEITYERKSESENAGIYTDELWPVYTPNPNYTVTEMPGTLTINKRKVALESESGEQVYNGKALTKPDVKIGDVKFVEGDAEVKATGTQTLVGESVNAIEITWADKTVAGNYEIIKTEGTLTVTAPENLNDYVVKTHEGQNFKVGDTVTFKITVTNIYAVKATVKLEEMAGMFFGENQTTLEDVLEPGETKTYTATRILTEQDFENRGVSNTVKVTLESEKDGKPDEISGMDTDEVPLKSKPDMSVVKTVLEPKESYRVGDTIRYQITVTNTGNVPLHDLELTDVMNADGKVTFPAGTDLTRETLNVGDSWIVTCSYVVRAADEGKTLSNTAKVITHKPGKDEPVVDKEDRTDGEPVEKRYSLTIHYRNAAGNAVAGSYSARYHVGDSFKIDSPIVAGYYDPQIRSISSGANGMPAQDLEYVVIYTAIPAPVDPDPEGPNPGPNVPDDDDDDDTPPVPNPEQEQPPQPQDFEIDPDDYTLTEVEYNETPLANLNLEGHTCCILHLLLMLAAMVVLGFDTKSRKKHQARIFELKKMLAMEEDHSDDPEQP